jgi:hypothetical protein
MELGGDGRAGCRGTAPPTHARPGEVRAEASEQTGPLRPGGPTPRCRRCRRFCTSSGCRASGSVRAPTGPEKWSFHGSVGQAESMPAGTRGRGGSSPPGGWPSRRVRHTRGPRRSAVSGSKKMPAHQSLVTPSAPRQACAMSKSRSGKSEDRRPARRSTTSAGTSPSPGRPEPETHRVLRARRCAIRSSAVRWA